MSITPASSDAAQVVVGTSGGASAATSGTVDATGGTVDVRSDWVDLSGAMGVTFDIAWSGGAGGPAGVFTVEVSNLDTPPDSSTACNTLPLGTAPAVLTGNSGFSAVDAPITAFRKARIKSHVTAGSLTLVIVAFAKRIAH